MNDTKKCFTQKHIFYSIEGDILYFYLFDLAMILKCSVKVTFKFLNGYFYFLLHILVADIQTFSKHYELVAFFRIIRHISTFAFGRAIRFYSKLFLDPFKKENDKNIIRRYLGIYRMPGNCLPWLLEVILHLRIRGEIELEELILGMIFTVTFLVLITRNKSFKGTISRN